MNRFDSIVVHHSASPRSTMIEAIRKWHTDKGWDDVGYHYVIEEDGSRKIGRRLPTTGAHAPPNNGRIGICVTGDNTQPGHEWNYSQILGLEAVITHFLAVMPWLEVVRHSDVKDTLCPGLSDEAWRGLQSGWGR